MFDAFPQLTRPIGAPKAPTFTKETPYKFSRQFEHLDVTLDCHPEPKCAGYTTEEACDGGLAACEWMKIYTPPGAPPKGACIDAPAAVFAWR